MKTIDNQEQIDNIVIAQANDDSAWESAISVRPDIRTSVSLPNEVATKATFIAKLHQTINVEDWLIRIIKERLDIEESIYKEIKHDFILKSS